MRKIFVGLAVMMSMYSTSSFAVCCGIVNEQLIIEQTTESVMTRIEAMWSGEIMPFLEKIAAQLQAEIEKQSSAQVKAAEAIATYQAQADLNNSAGNISRRFEPAPYTCETMDTASSMQKSSASASRSTQADTARFASNTLATQGPVAVASNLREKSLSTYLTESDRARYGISAAPSKFPGADMDTSYLFGSKSGSETYDEGQDKAVDDLIIRKTQLSAPKSLGGVDSEKTSDGMLYREVQRKYAAFASNVQNAYLSIKNNHVGQTVNGQKTPSVMELIKNFTETKFSPGNIIDNAGKSQEAVLRDIAMMDAARLWMDYQSLRYQEKMLALIADQQVLLTEQVVGSQADMLRTKIQGR